MLLLLLMLWAGEEPLYVGDASARAAQLPAPAITASLNIEPAEPAQSPFNSEPDIIVHKVKTETITGDALGPERDVR